MGARASYAERKGQRSSRRLVNLLRTLRVLSVVALACSVPLTVLAVLVPERVTFGVLEGLCTLATGAVGLLGTWNVLVRDRRGRARN